MDFNASESQLQSYPVRSSDDIRDVGNQIHISGKPNETTNVVYIGDFGFTPKGTKQERRVAA